MMTKDGPFWLVVLAVGSGAGLGAVLRWMLAYRLNGLLTWFPLGTFAANTLGGFLCGLVLAWIVANPALSPVVRLFLVTGFLGGLTTFSTFSAETLTLLLSGEFLRASVLVLMHVGCSLLAAWLGWLLARVLLL